MHHAKVNYILIRAKSALAIAIDANVCPYGMRLVNGKALPSCAFTVIGHIAHVLIPSLLG